MKKFFLYLLIKLLGLFCGLLFFGEIVFIVLRFNGAHRRDSMIRSRNAQQLRHYPNDIHHPAYVLQHNAPNNKNIQAIDRSPPRHEDGSKLTKVASFALPSFQHRDGLQQHLNSPQYGNNLELPLQSLNILENRIIQHVGVRHVDDPIFSDKNQPIQDSNLLRLNKGNNVQVSATKHFAVGNNVLSTTTNSKSDSQKIGKRSAPQEIHQTDMHDPNHSHRYNTVETVHPTSTIIQKNNGGRYEDKVPKTDLVPKVSDSLRTRKEKSYQDLPYHYSIHRFPGNGPEEGSVHQGILHPDPNLSNNKYHAITQEKIHSYQEKIRKFNEKHSINSADRKPPIPDSHVHPRQVSGNQDPPHIIFRYPANSDRESIGFKAEVMKPMVMDSSILAYQKQEEEEKLRSVRLALEERFFQNKLPLQIEVTCYNYSTIDNFIAIYQKPTYVCVLCILTCSGVKAMATENHCKASMLQPEEHEYLLVPL